MCRGKGAYDRIGTEELVPGDVIVIPAAGCVMHCDAVLLFGTCIVNESMLTGKCLIFLSLINSYINVDCPPMKGSPFLSLKLLYR